MNKTKAFINRVVIGVTLMTLAACTLTPHQQDSYSSRAGLMVAQFNEIQEQQTPADQGELNAIRRSFDMYHMALTSHIFAGLSQAFIQITCDNDINAMQVELWRAIDISHRTAQQKADAEAKRVADANQAADDDAVLAEKQKAAIASAPQEANKAYEAAMARAIRNKYFPLESPSAAVAPAAATGAESRIAVSNADTSRTPPPSSEQTMAIEAAPANNITQEIQFMDQSQQGAITTTPNPG